jgi:hypothetical protein
LRCWPKFVVACAAGLWTTQLAGCGGVADSEQRPTWQVVRAPGTSSCAAIVLREPGDFSHREQIGRYQSQAEAEAALERFKTTQDPMTVPGRRICQ